MAMKPLLDLDALFAPIDGDNPAGAFLRYAGDYDELKALLPKPDRDAFEASGQEGQWPKLVQLSTQKLRQKTKDLSIAGWLTEGLVRLHGFAGLRDGLLLVQGLCERYWDTIYPLPDEGDWEVRAAPLQALLERNLPLWIAEIPLTKEPVRDPETDEAIPVNYNLWHSIVVSQLEDKKPLQGAMEDAATNSPTEFLQTLHDDMVAVQTTLTALNHLLDEKLSSAAPSTVAAVDTLAKCKGRLATVLLKRGVRLGETADEGTSSEDATGEGAHDAAGHKSNGSLTGPIKNRQDALERLREVADFFRRTEPHSPVPYLIQRAMHWSRMSFEQLLVELVKDENARLQINDTLGLAADGGGGAYGAYDSSAAPADDSSTYQ